MTAAGCLLQQADDQVDRLAGQFRLIALDVDDDIDALQSPGDLGDAIGAAGRLGIGHFDVSAEGADGGEDFRRVGGDADAFGPPGPRGRLVGVLQAASCPSRAAAAFAAAWWRRAGRE